MNGQAKTRDVGVELMRIFCCLIVLGCHTYLPVKIKGTVDTSRVLVGMFCADGVAGFWLILGFFLFQQESIDKLWRRTIQRILIPMLVFIIFSFYVYPWVSGSVMTLRDSLFKSKEEYVELFKAFALWQPPDGMAHLWYLYVYVLLILLYPAIMGVVQSMERESKIKVFFLIGFVLVFIDNVFSSNQLMAFSHHTICGLVPAAMVVVFGHFVYKYRSFMERYGIFSPLVFLIMNGIRTILYLQGFTTIIYWYTCSGVVASVSIAAFSISLVSRLNSKKFEKAILYLSPLTFSIYLLHHYAIKILSRLHFQATLLKSLSALPGFLTDILYAAIMSLTVFCVSLLFAVPNQLAGRYLKKLRYRI